MAVRAAQQVVRENLKLPQPATIYAASRPSQPCLNPPIQLLCWPCSDLAAAAVPLAVAIAVVVYETLVRQRLFTFRTECISLVKQPT